MANKVIVGAKLATPKIKTKISDIEHLQWLHDRIVNVYGENKNVDFLIRFRTIINDVERFKKKL